MVNCVKNFDEVENINEVRQNHVARDQIRDGEIPLWCYADYENYTLILRDDIGIVDECSWEKHTFSRNLERKGVKEMRRRAEKEKDHEFWEWEEQLYASMQKKRSCPERRGGKTKEIL